METGLTDVVVVSGVGVAVGMWGVAVGAGEGVLVAGIRSGLSGGRAVGVVVGSSSHADSKAAASKHSSPTHDIRRTDFLTTPPTRRVTANCCHFLVSPQSPSTLHSYYTLGRIYRVKLSVSVKVLDFVQSDGLY